MKGTLKTLDPGLQNYLRKMADRSNNITTVFSQTIVPLYKNAQLDRWKTQGSSEGFSWKSLSPTYKNYKLRRFGGGIRYNWVGGRGTKETPWFDKEGRRRPWEEAGSWPSYLLKGTADLVATSTLLGSIVGAGPNPFGSQLLGTELNRTIITNRALHIYSAVDYYKDVDEQREIKRFGFKFWKTINAAVRKYIKSGDLSRGFVK